VFKLRYEENQYSVGKLFVDVAVRWCSGLIDILKPAAVNSRDKRTARKHERR
jgi:hypothetical protein